MRRSIISTEAVIPLLAALICLSAVRATSADTQLPAGTEVVWDLSQAYRETTTRERICVNGLWRWQSAVATADAVPVDD